MHKKKKKCSLNQENGEIINFKLKGVKTWKAPLVSKTLLYLMFEESENSWASKVWKHEGLYPQQSPLMAHLWSIGLNIQFQIGKSNLIELLISKKKCKVYKENNYSLNQENDMKNYQFSAQRFENMKGSPGSFEESENAWASEVWKHEGLLYQQSPLITHLWSRGQDNQIHKLFQIHYQLLQFSSLL